jgi:hypothetical protein
MNNNQGSSEDTLTFDSVDDQAYWYSDLTYPTGDDDASIAAGSYSLNMYFDARPSTTAPQVDAVTTASTGETIIFSHTTSGSDRLMLVGVSFRNDQSETVSSITYNGDALSSVGSVAQGTSARVEIWSLVAPDTGTHDIVVTFSTVLKRNALVGATTYSGVHQTTPLGTFVFDANTSAGPATIDASSATDELVFDTVACKDCGSLTVGAGQTQRWNLVQGTGGDSVYGAGSTEAGDTNVTMSWTLGASKDWAIGAVPIKPSGGSAPSVDASSSSYSDQKLTFSHTTAGSQRLMLVGLSIYNRGSETVSSITYNGDSLTSVGAVANGTNARVEIWRLIAPDTGTNDVVVTFSAPLARNAIVGAITYTGVHQTTPLGSFAPATGTSTSASVNASSATNELVFDTVACKDCDSLAFGGGQTQRWNESILSGGDSVYSGGSTEAGDTSVTMSWTLGDSKAWSIGAVPIKPADASVDITVSVYHTASDGSDPQEIVTSSSTGIDSSTTDPYELVIGSGGAQTFTSSDPRRLRVHIDVTAVNAGGSFTLAYDSAVNASNLSTPVVTVPDPSLLLLLVAIFIPQVMILAKRRSSSKRIPLPEKTNPPDSRPDLTIS